MNGGLFVGPCRDTYDGPVESSIPGYGGGRSFCSAPPATAPMSSPMGAGTGSFAGVADGDSVSPPPEDWDRLAIYSVVSDGCPVMEDVSAPMLRRNVELLVSDGIGSDEYYRELARDFYGDQSAGCESDLPTIGVNTVFVRGYVRGLRVGESVRIPGTRLDIVRTNNMKIRS